MEEDDKESILTGYPNVVSYEGTKKIISQMEKNICKIKIGNEQGTGFFCKIPFRKKDNMLPVLITNNHIINENILYKKDENISIYIEEKGWKKMDLKKRMKFTNIDFDTTIIEIKDRDEINNFLELDDIIIDDIINKIDKNDRLIDETLYIIQYPEGKLSVSYGILDKISEDKKYNFNHKCSTKGGSSGSPILNMNNNKIIGIHKEGHKNNYNRGTFLNYPIKLFIEQNIDKFNELNKRLNNEINNKEFPYKINNEINNKFKISDNYYFSSIDKVNFEEKPINIKEKNEQISDNSELDTITMIYNVRALKEENKKKKNKKDLQIFGEKFVYNNKPSIFLFFSKDNLKIIYKKKEYKFESYFDINKIEEDNFVEIKLKGISEIKNKSHMFSGCENLVFLSEIPNWITSKNTDISYMFNECRSLKSLPDVSRWDTSEVTNMEGIFYNCKSLISLPDISKWNTSKVNNMKSIFYNCISLISLPDISTWDISQVNNISYMFFSCYSLKSFPDISNWDISQVTYMNFTFGNGISDRNEFGELFSKTLKLTSLPDISRWDTSNVTEMIGLFSECESLLSLPDISKWNISKVKSIEYIFYACKKLISLPDISSWITSNITRMNYSFSYCISLKELPDISKWDTSNVEKMEYMFSKCESLTSLPDISNWKVSKVSDFNGMFHGCNSLPSSSFYKIRYWSPELFSVHNSLNLNCILF